MHDRIPTFLTNPSDSWVFYTNLTYSANRLIGVNFMNLTSQVLGAGRRKPAQQQRSSIVSISQVQSPVTGFLYSYISFQNPLKSSHSSTSFISNLSSTSKIPPPIYHHLPPPVWPSPGSPGQRPTRPWPSPRRRRRWPRPPAAGGRGVGRRSGGLHGRGGLGGLLGGAHRLHGRLSRVVKHQEM